ncbi:hypothetical protein [Microvirga yunnanensis]|nr:hypothetical protein [Microvirga sp. HBU65207]
MREKLQKLESIEARLSQHEKATRLGLIWLTILAFAVLILFGYHITYL